MTPNDISKINATLQEVSKELADAMTHNGSMKSPHEAYSITLEELDEFWNEVKRKEKDRDPRNMKKELEQIAAMACRAIINLNL